MTRHEKVQIWLGVLISLLFIWLALRGLQLDRFWDAVRGANYWWLLPGIAVYFVAVWARAWRWHYLLHPIKNVPTASMFPITAIGYMGNNIYPARAGEVLRAVVLRRREGVSVSASLATIIVERIFDGVVMLGFVFANLPELARLTSSSGFVGNIEQTGTHRYRCLRRCAADLPACGHVPLASLKIGGWFVQHLLPKGYGKGPRSSCTSSLTALPPCGPRLESSWSSSLRWSSGCSNRQVLVCDACF